MPYQVDISTEAAPFELATTFHQDFYITEPGKEVKIRFRVIRHQYDGPITIKSPVFQMEKAVIEEKRGDVEALINIPKESEPLVVTSFYGEAEIDGQTYRTTVDTKEPLKKTPLNMIQWPDGVSGKIYFLIKDVTKLFIKKMLLKNLILVSFDSGIGFSSKKASWSWCASSWQNVGPYQTMWTPFVLIFHAFPNGFQIVFRWISYGFPMDFYWFTEDFL